MRKHSAFTIVELLVVVSILVLLIALLLPTLQGAREVARDAQCKNNLRNVAMVQFRYGRDHRDYLLAAGPRPDNLSVFSQPFRLESPHRPWHVRHGEILSGGQLPEHSTVRAEVSAMLRSMGLDCPSVRGNILGMPLVPNVHVNRGAGGSAPGGSAFKWLRQRSDLSPDQLVWAADGNRYGLSHTQQGHSTEYQVPMFRHFSPVQVNEAHNVLNTPGTSEAMDPRGTGHANLSMLDGHVAGWKRDDYYDKFNVEFRTAITSN